VPDNVPVADHQGRLTMAAAGVAGTAAPASRPVLAGDAWQTSPRRWDLFYGLICAATIAVVGVTGGQADRRLIAIAAVAAMVPWFALLGRPLTTGAHADSPRRGVIFLAGMLVLFAVADGLAPNSWYLAIALCPMCFSVTTARRALIAVTVLSCCGAASVGYWSHGQPGAVVTAVCLAIFSVTFSAIYGNYVYKIIHQSSERAALIAQLEATQAQLADVSREAGALAERQRLAGEIHDTLAQGFSSILMLIQAAEVQLEDAPGTARRQLQLAGQTARENLAEARSLVSNLTPAQLQAGTLEDALRRITERAGAELGISAGFATSGEGRPLPAAKEVVLLRTGQEALANVRKHAAAQNVTVRLSYAGYLVRLEVTDDGDGFDPGQVNGGYGLSGMRSRVDEVGGSVAVRSAPAEGTSVVVEVPA
jgi:signal transduction histidine kinase